MNKVKIWIRAIRLHTLPVSLSGVLVAVGLAKWNGEFRLVPSLICVAFALLAQIVSNLANEYFDYEAGTDKKGRAGFRRGVTEGDIKPMTMKAVMVACLAATCLVGLSMLAVVPAGDGYANWLMLAGVGVLVAIFALAYSAGPYPLSYHALGEVAVMIFYGLVPVTFSYYVIAGHFEPYSVMTSIAMGFMGVNVLLVNNYRDVDDDVEAGKRTSVVVFGRGPALLAYLANGFLAVAVMGALWLKLWLQFGWHTSAPWAIYLLLHLATWAKMRKAEASALNPVLGATARNMLIFTVALVAVLLMHC